MGGLVSNEYFTFVSFGLVVNNWLGTPVTKAYKKNSRQIFFPFFICGHLKVTAVSFNDTSDQVLSGGIDNEIKVSKP